jgi:hypothetical protein
MPEKNYFQELYEIDVNDKTENRGGLVFLSWAWAWAEIKKKFPDASYTIYENKDGLNYHTDGKTCWVKTGVTINGHEHIEYLPVMDMRNKSIPLANVTSFDVNKAIQRSVTKAIARHGLGLYIYAGEDLPEVEPTSCTDCKRPIVGIGKLTAQQVEEGTLKAYGVALCGDCGSKRKVEAAKAAKKDKPSTEKEEG